MQTKFYKIAEIEGYVECAPVEATRKEEVYMGRSCNRPVRTTYLRPHRGVKWEEKETREI